MIMAHKDRSVQWVEQKIRKVLTKKKQITTYLAMSACVLENVRSIEEQRNLDRALANLIFRGLIKREKDKDGFTLYRLIGNAGTKESSDE
jgi:chaperonin cofactor prefoldin